MESPMIQATVQAAVLSATSNILAQCLTAYRKGETISLDSTSLFYFVVFALLNTPLNFYWQRYLEDAFPAYPAAAPTTNASLVNEKTKATNGKAKKGSISIKNTLAKFLLDQTLGALYNTIAFIGGMGLLKGQSWDQAVAAVQKDTLPLMAAGYKLWPLVSLLSFTVIPPKHRIVFGGIVGVGWGIFLSLFAAH